MGNCLVTKLKAVVDNPDLPIIETMQQFTLNAIAASNNNSMTDTQKWALNHFFFTIGAIHNTGIYTKMAYIGLPMIAGDVEGAIVNYVGNIAYGTYDNRIALVDHRLQATVAGNVTLGYTTLPKTLSKDNMEVFVGLKNSSTIFNFFGLQDTNSKKLNFSARADEFNIAEIPYTTMSTAKKYNANSLNKSINTINSSVAYYYDSSTQSIKTIPISTNDVLTIGNTNTYSIVAPSNATGIGVYYILVGENLTSEENVTLLNALVELRSAFLE